MVFDPGKESIHVLDPRATSPGPTFEILGVEFDNRLSMQAAIEDLVHKGRWKVRALLQARGYYGVEQMVLLYKTHVLPFVEHRTAAIYHAVDTLLATLDRVQETFLRELGLSELEALALFNLAPLSTRRDIAMLGVIHRAALGKGPAQLRAFFRPAPENPGQAGLRAEERRHHLHLDDSRIDDVRRLAVIDRSAFGLVAVYNMLPKEVVEHEDVSLFQGALQSLVKERALSGSEAWRKLLSPRWQRWQHPLR